MRRRSGFTTRKLVLEDIVFFRIEYRLASYHFDAFVCFTSLGCRQVDACQAERPSFLPEVWSTRPVKDRMVNLNWMVIFCGSCFVGVVFSDVIFVAFVFVGFGFWVCFCFSFFWPFCPVFIALLPSEQACPLELLQATSHTMDFYGILMFLVRGARCALPPQPSFSAAKSAAPATKNGNS